VLTGKIGAERTALAIPDDLDADWLLGRPATGLNLLARTVSLPGGEELPFDQLVIATGARPRQLAAAPPGPGVHYLRTLDDALAIKSDLATSQATVVIGAGFIGLEVASSAQELGVRVTVLETLPVPLERAIGAEIGRRIAEWHVGKGLDLRLGVGVEELLGGERAEGVRLADGLIVEADTVVVGVGVTPETRWLEGSGVDLDDGVVCDSRLRVLAGGRPVPGVVAAGDVVRWAQAGQGRGVRVEHWTNAAEQGQAAARTLIDGEEAPEFSPVPYFWSDQHGVKLQFVGHTEPGDEIALIDGDYSEDRFVVAYGRQGRLVAALGMRRPARVMGLQAQIAAGAPFPPES
jgi:3-phenylpropionate/trans-cinnamate dioxygenase ferredoxin reductase subunit